MMAISLKRAFEAVVLTTAVGLAAVMLMSNAALAKAPKGASVATRT